MSTEQVNHMTQEQFEALAKPGTIVPVFRKFNSDFITPVMAYLKIREAGTASFLLESVQKGENIGRYSFIGHSPFRTIKSTGGKTVIGDLRANRTLDENFFDVLKRELQNYRSVPVEGIPRFTCGAVGFIGYDMIRQIERIPESRRTPVDCDDASLAFYDNLIAIDHLKNEIILIANVFVDDDSHVPTLYRDAGHRLDTIIGKLNAPVTPKTEFHADEASFAANFTQEEFERAVVRAKEHIFAGDIFQVVLSQRFTIDYTGDVFQAYRSLRGINPSPYLFYLDFVDYQLVGSSPEPLIRLENNELEIIPIAGTRPRGATIEEDNRHAESLLADPKELAEHVMLVDLARNDMGRVSRHGSVRVLDFETVEKYSHVMHIISRVRGELKPHLTAVDAFRASFPAGTVSGAPKIRAMEIINDIEPDRRGFYAGSIGYFDYRNNMDMCITIRSMLAKDGKLHLQAGAGIVADSVPASEYQETLNKGMALRNAIKQASGGINDIIYR